VIIALLVIAVFARPAQPAGAFGYMGIMGLANNTDKCAYVFAGFAVRGKHEVVFAVSRPNNHDNTTDLKPSGPAKLETVEVVVRKQADCDGGMIADLHLEYKNRPFRPNLFFLRHVGGKYNLKSNAGNDPGVTN
jgi:hypothetical protein